MFAPPPKTDGAAAGSVWLLLLVPNPIDGAWVFPPKLKAGLAGSCGLSPNLPKILAEAAAGAGLAAFCPKLKPPIDCAAGCAGAPKENVESVFGAGAGVAAAFWLKENIPVLGCASVFCPKEPNVEAAVGAAKPEVVVAGAKLEFVVEVKPGFVLTGKTVLAVVTAG